MTGLDERTDRNIQKRQANALERIAKALERTAAALEASGDTAQRLSEEFDLADILRDQPGVDDFEPGVFTINDSVYSEGELNAMGYLVSDDRTRVTDENGVEVGFIVNPIEPMDAEDGLESGHDDSDSDPGDRAR